MKVKLLKKIRKVWSIYKVTDIGTQATMKERSSLEKYGYPFFRLIEEDHISFYVWTYKTEQECKEHILRRVRSEYSHKMKSKNNFKEEKVWHV